MSLALDDLTKPVTVAEARASFYAVLEIIGVRTTNWRPFAITRSLITMFAVVFASLSALVAAIARGGFLQLAIGAWLTLLARYIYGTERQLATFATGNITLTRTGGGVYSFAADAWEVQNPTTGKVYRNSVAFDLPDGASDVVTFEIHAVEAGSASTSAPGTVTDIISSMLDVTATNPAALIGTDEETDEDLRARCLDSTGALSPNGPADAYAYIARSTLRPDGTPIGVNRVREEPDGFGRLAVYLATPSGAVASADVAILDEAIQTQAAPLAITVDTASASTLTVGISYGVFCYRTTPLTAAQVQGRIAVALGALFTRQPLGGNVIGGASGKLYREDIIAAIEGATDTAGQRLPLFGATLSSPAADVSLIRSAVPLLGAITASVTLVNPNGLAL